MKAICNAYHLLALLKQYFFKGLTFDRHLEGATGIQMNDVNELARDAING